MLAANLAIIIRFKNSASTLPAVLSAILAQTLQPLRILGIDSGSTDNSAELLRKAGAEVVGWQKAYHHSKVLNFATGLCREELILVLSSHTVLEDPRTIERMVTALCLPRTACVSGKWSPNDDWSDEITWDELQRTGLRFCSIYSNSFGMFRRSLWEKCPFDESLVTMEDYAWALQQVRAGLVCRRLDFPFRYQRSSHNREFTFAATTFHLARRHGLSVRWLGVKGSIKALGEGFGRRIFRRSATLRPHYQRLRAKIASTLSRGSYCPQSER
jgi:glycosyltransferase involved in cell wall biosynthesis